MPKKLKHQKITFGSIIRLIIFSLIVYFSISWLSSKKQLDSSFTDPTVVLGEQTQSTFFTDLYQKIPESSRIKFDSVINNSSKFIQDKLNGFPDRQIKELKKGIIKNISDDIIKSIDKN